jgi:hypothetical protein
MKTVNVLPLVGVDDLRFGMKRTKVHELLGTSFSTFQKTPSALHPTDAWLGGGFQVFYGGPDACVEYIELSRDSGFSAMLFGQSVFATEASQVAALIEKHAPFDKSDPELGYSYVFPDLELSLWRPIAEPPEGRFFSTVGVGTKGY